MNNTNIENGIYFIYDGGVWLNKCINGCGEVFSGMYFINLEQSKVKVTKSIGEYFEGNYGSIVLEILEESKDIVNVAIDTAQWSREADYLKEFLWDELKGKMYFVRDDLEELTVQNGVIYIEFHDVGDWFYLKPHTSLSK